MLIPIFQDHNNKIKAFFLGEEFSKGTLCRYTTALKHTTVFLQWKYGISDINIRKIDHAFITEFEFYSKKHFIKVIAREKKKIQFGCKR